ncbi:MAG: hypothetical protein RIR77_756, partial [Planctomycetota bacterium]
MRMGRDGKGRTRMMRCQACVLSPPVRYSSRLRAI